MKIEQSQIVSVFFHPFVYDDNKPDDLNESARLKMNDFFSKTTL